MTLKQSFRRARKQVRDATPSGATLAKRVEAAAFLARMEACAVCKAPHPKHWSCS